MDILIGVYIAVLGAAMGSFAGAVAWRLEKKRDFVKERSECEHCHHVLAWYDLVPVVSWLALRGRCRYCRKPIGISALMLELGLAAAFAVSYVVWSYGFDTLGISLLVLWLISLVLLTILFVYDIRHFLLPDKVMWPLIGVGAVIFVLLMLQGDVAVSRWPLEAFLALLPITGVYGLLHAVSGGKWIGFGDVKLGIFIGLVLGWQGGFMALLLANYLGFFWILPSMLRGKLKSTTHLPFGPFLILATYIVFLWKQPILDWISTFLGV